MPCRLIRIHGKQEYILLLATAIPGNVGMVNARIGTHKAKLVLDNDRANSRANDFIAFLKDKFYNTRIFFRLFCERNGFF